MEAVVTGTQAGSGAFRRATSDDDGDGDWSDGAGQAFTESTEGRVDPSRIVIDTSLAHPARRYDYLLGGKTHYAADRESADAIESAFPGIRIAALENRRFLRRAVTMLAGTYGIDQFLDIGTGIPSPGNTHEVAQSVLPHARVLYVDNDPVVLAHSQALLTSSGAGRTAYIEADLRRPAEILEHPALRSTLDLNRPVGLIIVAVLHFLPDSDRPQQLIDQIVAALPAGSFLVLSHGTWDFMPTEMIAQIKALPTPKTGV